MKILHLEDHALDATFVRDLLPAALALPRGNGELILVVDDESDIRDVTTTTLSRHGYRVVAAHDGSDAFALFAPRSRELSVMITDLNMPRLDGAPSPALSAVSTPP